MSRDILDRLTGIMTKERAQTSTDIREAAKEIVRLRKVVRTLQMQVESLGRHCRNMDVKRKETYEMLTIAVRMMDYQRPPK